MTTYMIVDGEGQALTDGLQAHEAERIAQRLANDRGEPVWLHGPEIEDEDGERYDPETDDETDVSALDERQALADRLADEADNAYHERHDGET